jgi:hypothetical protein
MKNRNIKAQPIVDRGDTAAIFVEDVAAIIDGFTVTHVILALPLVLADSELPTAMYHRVMVRFIIPTDKRHEMSKQIAAKPRLCQRKGWR